MSTSDIWLSAQGLGSDPRSVVDMTVEDIMKTQDVSRREAYERRKQATAEVKSEGASPSLAQEILGLLVNGHMKDVETLREALFFKGHSSSPHDIVKAVWSLQKRGLVTFYERKAGRDSIISKIKLTPRGEVDTGLRTDHDNTKPASVKGSKELKRRSPVGKDMTDAKNHHWVAKGGDVERVGGFVHKEPEVINTEPYDIGSNGAIIDRMAATTPAPLNQNEKPEVPRDPFRGFPLIRALVDRKDQAAKLEAAAEALLEAGQEEMANEVLAKIQFTDLEKEILGYVNRSAS